MRIAFFLNNKSLPNKDYSDIINFNNGLPGSEYEFLLVSYLLDKRDNNLEVYLFVNFEASLPHSNIVKVNNLGDCCSYCVNNDILKLVIDGKYFDKNILDNYSHLQYIIWAHNTLSIKTLTLLNELNYIKRLVCVGREQLELFRDHPITWKSTYIYNIFPINDVEHYKQCILKKDNHNVVYMGCLIEEKGFHLLAKIWKDILRDVPDAKLYVIGDGRVYDSNAELGNYGLASPEYENKFIPYLLDENGNIMSSVHFMGRLGFEKYDILKKCKVGIPSPTCASETFCIVALEMQLYGCVVTSYKKPALLDTVVNRKNLYKSESELKKYVVKLLKSTIDNNEYSYTYNYLQLNFNINDNIKRWECLFNDGLLIEPISRNNFHQKYIKNILLYIKKYFPYANRFPLIEKIYNAYYMNINRRDKILLPN